MPRIVAVTFCISVLLGGCVAPQSAVNDPVNATFTAAERPSDAMSATITGTLAETPPPKVVTKGTSQPPGELSPLPTATSIACREDMAELRLVGVSFLRNNREMVTLDKPTAFGEETYLLMFDRVTATCQTADGNPTRLHCIGRLGTDISIPASDGGQLTIYSPHVSRVVMTDPGETCTYELPFDTIPLPAKPGPEDDSGSSDGSGGPSSTPVPGGGPGTGPPCC